jgi:acyl-CoA hydrolase
MRVLSDVEACVDLALERVGKRIRLGTPLGIGKPIALLNAFYRRAKADPSIDLHIMTALTLERPKGKSELEQRFLKPFVERVFGGYPDLEYELDRVANKLPENVRVIEFYFYAGKYVGNLAAQRDYICTNYTFVARDLLERGLNVVAQEIVQGAIDGQPHYSLSCNPDVSVQLVRALHEQRVQGRNATPSMILGQINTQLPFMHGEALVSPEVFDCIIDAPGDYHPLFGTPKTAIADDEYMIGLYASTLVRDGGTLQIGIGAIGDALVYALKLRHEHNDVYLELLKRMRVQERFGATIDRVGGTAPFKEGLFACSEMFVDGFQHLIEAGIVKRKVYDWEPLQRLIDEEKIDERIGAGTLEALALNGAIDSTLDERSLRALQHFGVLRSELKLEDGRLVMPDGSSVEACLDRPECIARIAKLGLGDTLRHGALVHAGFILGPESFYAWLRGLPNGLRAAIQMRGIDRINDIHGAESLNRMQRRDARFVNTAMMVTLLGGAVSDGLANGQVISGVGGQYNFVAMGHALHDARSVLQVRSTRKKAGSVHSNIVYEYGHTTIARHLRDIVVTDHGIADLRAKTDGEVIDALLSVADARFQSALTERAKAEGKLDPSYILPEQHGYNDAPRYRRKLAELRERGYFPAYPFGSDLTEQERVLARALTELKDKIESTGGKLEVLADALLDGALHDDVQPYLERMGLAAPNTIKETIYQRLLAAELRQLGVGAEDD